MASNSSELNSSEQNSSKLRHTATSLEVVRLFEGLTARRLWKSFGVKGNIRKQICCIYHSLQKNKIT